MWRVLASDLAWTQLAVSAGAPARALAGNAAGAKPSGGQTFMWREDQKATPLESFVFKFSGHASLEKSQWSRR